LMMSGVKSQCCIVPVMAVLFERCPSAVGPQARVGASVQASRVWGTLAGRILWTWVLVACVQAGIAASGAFP
jgi:hypothetical protein